MATSSAFDPFLAFVRSVNTGATARSENDLSSKLGQALESLGLSAVLDTGQVGGKRPDLLGYCSALDADLLLPAEVVVESKKPSEVSGYASLGEAMTSDEFWTTKTVPYIKANLSRIQYFCFTSFVDFGFLPMTAELRAGFARPAAVVSADKALRARVLSSTVHLSLAALGSAAEKPAATAWKTWITTHLAPSALQPLILSVVRNTIPLVSVEDLEGFAGRLAALAAGPGSGSSSGGIFADVSGALPDAEDDLDADTRRDLRIFAMAQSPSLDAAFIDKDLKDNYLAWRDEFIGASIHSVVSRLFALKVIEDVYCVGASPPLIEKKLWVLNSDVYDGQDPTTLRASVMDRIRALKASKNGVVENLAVFGAFFDWISDHLDPLIFRTLFELFVTFDFRHLPHDLLGRFFELYSQRINDRKRKALGQYYTPVPIVRYMWSLVSKELPKPPVAITVLDPAMGSGTFLKEGAQWLAGRGHRFWERMVGFDISPQVMGIAQANVYMAVLRQVDAADALNVTGLRLFTTDSLDPRNGHLLKTIAPLFTDPSHRRFLENTIEVSASIKKEQHFRVVIGNPPYKNNSVLTLSEVHRRFPALLESSNAEARAQVRNIRDDYAWFFAAADHYVSGDNGLICFITSDSYTRKQSYQHFRAELLRHYEVVRLVRLGRRVFPDVSPRISFAIVLLRKRSGPLADLSRVAPFPFVDYSALVQGAAEEDIGTERDPRLKLMAAVANGRKPDLASSPHAPTASHGYSLLPIEEALVGAVLKDGFPVYEKGKPRLFTSKWPGMITAFDTFLRAPEEGDLHRRVSSFFKLVLANRSNHRQLTIKVAQWAAKTGYGDEDADRLGALADQIAKGGLTYTRSNIRRSFTGSIPNEKRWYPPPEHRCVVYYEPRFHFERNVNKGKAKGWGTMEQWREPASHTITPKLIYTTSTNPSHGYKAFVVSDEWYVKLHGGTSQQYHYTGLIDPSASTTLGGMPNNLSAGGEQLLHSLMGFGLTPADLLFYVAAIQNSGLAERFLLEESGHDLHIRIPKPAQRKTASEIVALARDLRDLHRVLHDAPSASPVPAAFMETLAPQDLLESVGARRRELGSGKFRSASEYRFSATFRDDLAAAIEDKQTALDELVEALYS